MKTLPLFRTEGHDQADRCEARTRAVQRRANALAPRGSPRERLEAVAAGDQPLRQEDLVALLGHHVLDADKRTRDLGERFAFLIEALFQQASSKEVDLSAVADMIGRFDHLYQNAMAALRKNVELLAALARQDKPTVNIVAAGAQLNIGGAAQQVVGAVGLGGRRR